MMLSISFLFLLCASLVPAVLGEEYAIRTLLNHGDALPSGEVCTSDEWELITGAMDGAQRRNLRTAERRLKDPFWCDLLCQGWKPGHCYLAYWACTSYRRREAELTEQEPSASTGGGTLRELQSQESCSDRISNINNALDDLEPSLTTGCQAVLDTSREFSCYEVVVGEE